MKQELEKRENVEEEEVKEGQRGRVVMSRILYRVQEVPGWKHGPHIRDVSGFSHLYHHTKFFIIAGSSSRRIPCNSSSVMFP
jgi:hypothetical protein